jgi:hypothetical protein
MNLVCYLNVPLKFPQCSWCFPQMFPKWSPNVPWIFLKWSLNASQMFPRVPRMFPEFSPNVPWMFPDWSPQSWTLQTWPPWSNHYRPVRRMFRLTWLPPRRSAGRAFALVHCGILTQTLLVCCLRDVMREEPLHECIVGFSCRRC